jgi:hypothetical protein
VRGHETYDLQFAPPARRVGCRTGADGRADGHPPPEDKQWKQPSRAGS